LRNTVPNLTDLRCLSEPDVANAARVLARSFPDDPMIRYVFLDEPEAERKMLLLFKVIVRYGLTYGEVYAPSSNIEGVAIWHTSDNNIWDQAKLEECGLSEFSSQVSPAVMEKIVLLDDFAISRKKMNVPFRHWYLAFIGVDPEHHGKGFASALIKPMLERIDRENMPCYLETATEKNAAIYGHLGFKLIEKVLVPGTNVYLYTMLIGRNKR